RAFETARRIRVVVLDKTGTLTEGRMTVTAVVTGPGNDPGAADTALLLAGAVEDGSEHPVGQAIAREAAARFGGLPPVSGFSSLAGAGVTGQVGGQNVVVGSQALLAQCHVRVPAALDKAAAGAEQEGHTAVLVGWDGLARAVVALPHPVRPRSADA